MARTGTAYTVSETARRGDGLNLLLTAGSALIGFALLAAPLARSAEVPADAPESARLLYAPHGDARTGFYTPWSSDPKSLWGLLRWQLFSRNPYDKSHAPVVPVAVNDGSRLAGVEHSASFTWVGHATFAIHDGAD